MTAIEPILKKLTDAEVRVLLLQLGKPGLLAEWERNRQIEYALKRFNEKCSLHDVAVELAAHFGISVQTAYRRAGEALSHHSRYGETKSGENGLTF